ncbi:CcdB family protein [Mesoterricola silvestris]|uniref:Toxin CcdB n=1 Tax=Mesoterricola silvestris TaxID=2927979 RepID=A0AA48H7T0_9BACT|nr:CcdB family protein [Mesoterricola silvestris]BDU73353.1 hypothetical protein METEAL_25270 [Mesoterricola silvestris]
MAQFSVHANPNARSKGEVPYLLDVQSDLMSLLATRVVVPLYRPEGARSQALTRLTPEVRFQGMPLIAMVPEMAGIRGRDLGAAVGELASARKEILQAIDLLLTGF